MSRNAAVLVLLIAAALEAGGDALMRIGLRMNVLWQRTAIFALGAMVLFAYGWIVNAPLWGFGKLIGGYVVFFFAHRPADFLVGFQAHSLVCGSGRGNVPRRDLSPQPLQVGSFLVGARLQPGL